MRKIADKMNLQSRYDPMLLALFTVGIFLSKLEVHTCDNVEESNLNVGFADWEVKLDFKCPTTYGSYPDTEDCKRYYRCIGGRPVHLRCGNTQKFDKYKKKCVSSKIAICDKREKTTTPSDGWITTVKDNKFVCPSLLGNFPNFEDCSSYYTCRLFIPSLKQCPENELFEAVKKECKPEGEVECGSRKKPTRKTTVILPSTTLEPTTTTELPSTQEYTTTQESTTMEDTTTKEPIITQVPITTQESTATEEPTTLKVTPTIQGSTTMEEITTVPTSTTTEEPTTTEEATTTSPHSPKPTGPPETDCDEDDLDCIITETGEIPDWFECPVELGAYRHPSNRKLFIYCQNWKPYVKKCGQDLIFSSEAGTCVFPN